ncbi:hypothetical protein GCM10011490_24190 [Pseudoclavibacter endophyticus]|uniref:Head-to-tail adaptor n=1 Tax=Pseudoclavibacter endophyticus TaxID=1778590 RepID=A0A6H9WQS4_9MICO|nr:hypothetical protein [Pseudoclavibacter endophyticus]KAB1648421.1 hypothetical protein F8O04_12105 [Pseudoclavibacter endophyticus]GGA72577.1 hypothetical protein GCM10011490_24190 [Pseudoclavibacter endophyticus]
MAGAPLADHEQISAWLGLSAPAPGSPESERAATVVSVISDLARGEARRPDWTLETVPEQVSAIVLMVAASAYVNPDGKTSVTTEEVTRRWERGELFSASQIATLRACRPGSSGGISTIQYGPSWETRSIWAPTSNGGPVHLYDGRGY